MTVQGTTTTQQTNTAARRPLARTLYIIGSLAFIGIGLMHTFVHFQDLSGSDLERRFDQIDPVMLGEDPYRAWELFQGISLLMGFFAIAIGVINLGALAGRAVAPAAVGMANIATLIAVITVGFLYLSALQTVGGTIGIGLFLPTALSRPSVGQRATQGK